MCGIAGIVHLDGEPVDRALLVRVAAQDRLLFASEIKALLQHPDVSARVCAKALSEYFTFQNIFSDVTLFDGVRLLPPGCTLFVDLHARRSVQTRYWDYRFAVDGL